MMEIKVIKTDRGFVHPRFSRELLGNMSWKLLHLISAFVPEVLDSNSEEEINQFLSLL
jgi:hypothetical protein